MGLRKYIKVRIPTINAEMASNLEILEMGTVLFFWCVDSFSDFPRPYLIAANKVEIKEKVNTSIAARNILDQRGAEDAFVVSPAGNPPPILPLEASQLSKSCPEATSAKNKTKMIAKR